MKITYVWRRDRCRPDCYLFEPVPFRSTPVLIKPADVISGSRHLSAYSILQKTHTVLLFPDSYSVYWINPGRHISLPDQRHLFCLAPRAGFKFVKIYTAGKITSFEFDFIISRSFMFINEDTYFPAENVVND